MSARRGRRPPGSWPIRRAPRGPGCTAPATWSGGPATASWSTWDGPISRSRSGGAEWNPARSRWSSPPYRVSMRWPSSHVTISDPRRSWSPTCALGGKSRPALSVACSTPRPSAHTAGGGSPATWFRSGWSCSTHFLRPGRENSTSARCRPRYSASAQRISGRRIRPPSGRSWLSWRRRSTATGSASRTTCSRWAPTRCSPPGWWRGHASTTGSGSP